MTYDESNQLLWQSLQDGTISKVEASVLGVDLAVYKEFQSVAMYKVHQANERAKASLEARRAQIRRRTSETITFNNKGYTK